MSFGVFYLNSNKMCEKHLPIDQTFIVLKLPIKNDSAHLWLNGLFPVSLFQHTGDGRWHEAHFWCVAISVGKTCIVAPGLQLGYWNAFIACAKLQTVSTVSKLTVVHTSNPKTQKAEVGDQKCAFIPGYTSFRPAWET